MGEDDAGAEPREPLIGRGRAPDSGGEAMASPPTEAESPAARSIPRPSLEPARRLAAAWTPARLRLGLGIALVAVLAVAWFAMSSRATPTGAGAPAPTSAEATTTTPTTR